MEINTDIKLSMQSIDTMFYRKGNREYDNKGRQKNWDFIPFNRESFIRGMTTIKRDHPKHTSFIDIGCGIGTKLILAHRFGYSVSGYEYADDIYWVGYAVLQNNVKPFKHGDTIIKMDVCTDAFFNHISKISKNTIVYFYSPLYAKKSARWITKLIRALPKGVLIYPKMHDESEIRSFKRALKAKRIKEVTSDDGDSLYQRI